MMFLLVADRWKVHQLQSEQDSHLQPPAQDSAILRSDLLNQGSDQLHRGSHQPDHRSVLQPPAVSTQFRKLLGDEGDFLHPLH